MSGRASVKRAAAEYRLGRVLVTFEDGPLADPCEMWWGTTQHGYANRRVNGELELEHRRRWRDANGPIPKGHDVHHRCGRRRCINLGHLELVSRSNHVRFHRGEAISDAVKAETARQRHQSMRAVEDHRLISPKARTQ